MQTNLALADERLELPGPEDGLEAPDLDTYDYIILAHSGGKDSTAAFLKLLGEGVAKERLEIWHHSVDGREGSTLMDWPCTEDYVRKFGEAFGVPVYFSWRVGGFERELLKENAQMAPARFERADGGIGEAGGTKSKVATRRRFPQVAGDPSVRWCTDVVKTGPADFAIRHQERFMGKRTLMVTGERAEESPRRAKYKRFQHHTTHCKSRTVHHWRAVHDWTRERVWFEIARHRINPHPAYDLGWGRCSCRGCIFGREDQWASLKVVDPEGFQRIADLEEEFGWTIDRERSVEEMAGQGKPYPSITAERVRTAMSKTFDAPIILPEGEWEMPAGAFGADVGPT